MHIKQMDPDVLARVAAEDLSFGEAVKRGAPEVPLPIAVGTREHLAGCGLTGTRRPALKTPGNR